MRTTEPQFTIRGFYRDIIRRPDGSIAWDSGVSKNAIVGDCRRLLAALLRGEAATAGIQGLQFGAGNANWDTAGTPPASTSQVALVDPHPYTVPVASLTFNYLTGATVSGTPTNRLQIAASLGPNVPTWPDVNHADGTLREFGLAGSLQGVTVLVDYVTHPAIVKDPSSTLDRTIWLVF